MEEIKSLTDKGKAAGAFEALQFEYAAMAAWYDSFWSDYLNKTFQLPLQILMTRARSCSSIEDSVEEAGIKQRDSAVTVVDIACGTGEFVKRAKQSLTKEDDNEGEGFAFYGIEPCPEMLAEARQKDDDVQWIESAAEAVPLSDATADVVCSTSAFHFFRNKPLALSQMHRILRPGGQLIITDWCADYFLVRLYHCFELLRWNFRFSHRYPGPLPSKTLRQLVEEAGYQDVRVETYTVRFWFAIIWGMQTVTATKP